MKSTAESSSTELKEKIRKLALDEGFDAAGFAEPEVSKLEQANLQEFVASGLHGDMHWLASRMDERIDPKKLWSEVKTVICLGLNYAPVGNPLEKLQHPHLANISCYAMGDDYHDIIKKMLKSLAGKILKELAGADCNSLDSGTAYRLPPPPAGGARGGNLSSSGSINTCPPLNPPPHAGGETSNVHPGQKTPGNVKVFVDTAPVMEKVLAAKTPLGWQGKHTCIVSREFGSWLFLGEIFLNVELPPDPPHRPSCGNCTACIDICPTKAIIAPGKLDATRCISYLTIEHKGPIPEEFHKDIGNRIYGCDDCLAVCPWNKFAQTARETRLHARTELQNISLDALAQLDDASFRALFRKSPIKRIGFERFMRNVRIAIKNRDAVT